MSKLTEKVLDKLGMPPLTESNVPKVHNFTDFKRSAEEWAFANTHHGKVNIKKHDAVLPNGKILRQTLSLGHANTGHSYIIGVFNHEGKDSDKGHGWHHHRDQGINEEVNEAFSDTVKKVGKKLAARPNKGAMPAAGRTKKMTEEEQLDEGKMKELSTDLEGPDSLPDKDFHTKYGRTKEEWHGILGTKPKAKSQAREPRQEFPTEEVELDEATAPKYDPAKMDEFEASREYQYHAGQAAFHRNSQGWTGKFNDIYNRDWKKEAAHHERHMKALKKVLDYHKTRKEEAVALPTLDEEIELQEGPSFADMHPDNINAIIKDHGKRHMVMTGPGEPMQHGLGFKELKAKLGIGTSASVHKKFVDHLAKNGFKSSWSHTSNEWVAHPK